MNLKYKGTSFERRAEKFKIEIGYSTPDGHKLTPGFVVVPWVDFLTRTLSIDGWSSAEKGTGFSDDDGYQEFTCTYKRGSQTMYLYIKWFFDGGRSAQDEMLYSSVMTTRGEPVFVRGPSLGDFCLRDKDGTGAIRSIQWAFANVSCAIQLDSRPSDDIGVLPLAKSIQAAMEKSVNNSINASQASIVNVDCSNRRPNVGDNFVINIRLDEQNKGRPVKFNTRCDGDLIEYVSTSDLAHLEYKAKAPGKAAVRVYISDPDTLVTNQVVVSIDAQSIAAP